MRAVAALAAAGIAAGALVATATGASAASKPCAGYTYRGKIAIKNPLYGKEGYKRRTVGYVYWYQKTPRHTVPWVCAVTRPLDKYIGKTTLLDVYLSTVKGSDRDSGNFKRYAGPVYLARTASMSVDAEIRFKKSVFHGESYTTRADL
jgi:hypothetical protein